MLLHNTFEGGTAGAGLTTGAGGNTAAGGDFFDVVTAGSGASITFDNAHPARSPMQVKFTTPATAVTDFIEWTTQIGTAVPKMYFRIYLFLTALPASTLVIARFDDGSAAQCSRLQINASGLLQMNNAGNSAQIISTNAVATGQWVRIEGFVNGSATVGQIEFKLFNSADSLTATETKTSAATFNTTGSIAGARFGIVTVGIASETFWMDDLGVSSTAYMGPTVVTSTGGVSLKKPRLTGAGSAGNLFTNSFEGGTNGATLTAGSGGNTGGSSGNFFDAITLNTGATLTFSNARQARTPKSANITTDASGETVFVKWSSSFHGTITKLYFRIYALFDALPASNLILVRYDDSSGAQIAKLQVGPTGLLTFADSLNGHQISTTTPIPVGHWFRIEGFVLASPTVGQMEFSLFSPADSPTATVTKTSFPSANTGSSIAAVRFGISGTAVANASFYMDDLGLSDAGYMGPTISNNVVGSGGVSLKKPRLTGKQKLVATGGVHLNKPFLFGGAGTHVTGTGGVSLKKMGLRGSTRTLTQIRVFSEWTSCTVRARINGAWIVALPKIRINGVWVVIALSETGTRRVTGSVSLKKPKLHGTGSLKNSGMGGVKLNKPILHGVVANAVAGSGGVKLHTPKLKGFKTTNASMPFGCDSNHFSSYKSVIPQANCARVYASPSEGTAGIPADWPIHTGAVPGGATHYVVSFRPNDLAGFISGKYDSQTKAWLSQLPNKTFVVVYHEANLPNDYFRTTLAGQPADFVSACHKLQNLAGTANSTLQIGVILGAYRTIVTGSPWIPKNLDFYALDGYGGGNHNGPGQTAAQVFNASWDGIDSVQSGATLAIAEDNTSANTNALVNQYFKDSFKMAVDGQYAFFMTWWGSSPTSNPVDFDPAGPYVTTLQNLAASL